MTKWTRDFGWSATLSMALVLAGSLALGCSAADDGEADEATDGSESIDGTDLTDPTDGTGATDATEPVGGTDPNTVTYHRDMAPLIASRCQSCHVAGGIAPFALDSYAAAKPLSALLADTVAARRMPPFSARETAECQPARAYLHDIRLSDEEIALFAAWKDAGSPEGDPATATELPKPPPIALSKVSKALTAKTGYVAEGKQDKFICFVLDPELTETGYLNGVNFVPGNPLVAHHALLYLDTKRESEGLADAGGQYPCFGGPGIKETQLVGAWAPGGQPLELPENAAQEIPAGSLIIMQMHYHPLGPAADIDQTTVEMKFLDGKPEYLSFAALIGNFDDEKDGLLPGEGDDGQAEFRIPAGAVGHTETMEFRIPVELGGQEMPDFRVWAVAPHMHYVGKDMLIEVERWPEDTPFCDQTALAPLLVCLTTKCVDAEDVADCVQESCGQEYGSLTAECQGCLTGYTALGQSAQDVIASCTTPRESFGEAIDECLIHTPEYDFSWQRFYAYDVPIEELPTLRKGDLLKFRCVYDNSMNNTAVASALGYQSLDAPIDVFLGDTTLDEMCLVALQLVYKAGD